jgi:hypothetical protein
LFSSYVELKGFGNLSAKMGKICGRGKEDLVYIFNGMVIFIEK